METHAQAARRLLWWKALGLAALFVGINVGVGLLGGLIVGLVEGPRDPDVFTGEHARAWLWVLASGIAVASLAVWSIGRRYARGATLGPRDALRATLRFLIPTVLFVFGANLLQNTLLWLLPVTPEQYLEFAGEIADLPLASLLVALVLVPAVFEELAFRGAIQPGLTRAHGPVVGVVFATLLFALVHVEPYQAIGVFIGGLALGYLRHVSETIGPAVIAHALGNLMAVLSMRSADPATPAPSLGPGDLASAAILGVGLVALAVFLCTRIRRRHPEGAQERTNHEESAGGPLQS